MGHNKQSVTRLAKAHHFRKAFLLKRLISDRKYFVYNQDIRINMHRHGKGKTHHHACRVGAQRFVYKLTELRKFHNLAEESIGSLPAQPQQGSVQPQVLCTSEVKVQSRSQVKERRHTTIDVNHPRVRRCETANQTQQCSLARAIST